MVLLVLISIVLEETWKITFSFAYLFGEDVANACTALCLGFGVGFRMLNSTKPHITILALVLSLFLCRTDTAVQSG
jgi:hypothetical protein